jgi:hypothetical protein
MGQVKGSLQQSKSKLGQYSLQECKGAASFWAAHCVIPNLLCG